MQIILIWLIHSMCVGVTNQIFHLEGIQVFNKLIHSFINYETVTRKSRKLDSKKILLWK